MELKDLVQSHVLQGIELGTEEFKDWCGDMCQRDFILFRLDNVTYKATEDPDDGYRSYCEDLEIVDKIPEIKLPDIEVHCRMDLGHKRGRWDDETNEILEFIDAKNGECILRIGTGNTDDYYPYCVLDYMPEKMHCNQDKVEEEETPTIVKWIEEKCKQSFNEVRYAVALAKDDVIMDENGNPITQERDNHTRHIEPVKCDTYKVEVLGIDLGVDISKELKMLGLDKENGDD